MPRLSRLAWRRACLEANRETGAETSSGGPSCYVPPPAAGGRQLLFDLVAIVGSVGEHENHRARLADRAHDRLLVILARRDVPARDPASGAAPLDRLADGDGLLAVGRGVADEHRARHGS